MAGGWFIGNFVPAAVHTSMFEVCLKKYKQGECEPSHFQHTAQELTLIIRGVAKMNGEQFSEGDIVIIEPLEIADFLAVTDVELVAVKWPSLPADKEVA